MDAVSTEELFRPSSGGGQVFSRFWIPPGEAVALLEISHGMAEHIGRYDAFASYLAERGFVVFGNDHLGHGKSIRDGKHGYFAPKNGWEHVIRDMDSLLDSARIRFGDLPAFLFGHSMGSMLARSYVARHGDKLYGAIFSGTIGKSPTARIGRTLARLACLARGRDSVSKLLNDMSSKGFVSRIENPRSKFAWISSDPQIEDDYNASELCGFPFTNRAFYDLSGGIVEISSPKWAQRVPKDLPMYLYAGDQDPVGNYGAGVRQVYDALVGSGHTDVQIRLYEGGRHEMHNESNRQQVYEDVYRWLTDQI